MSLHVNKTRLFLALIAFVSVIVAPWWVPLLLATLLCLRWRAWEVVGIGLCMDLLFMPLSISFSWEAVPWATITALVLLLMFEPLRRRLLTGPALL